MRLPAILCLLGLLFSGAGAARGAEVTIITHGFQFASSTPSKWTYTMADAILDRADGSANRLTTYGSIYVHDTSTGGWKAANVPNRTSTDRTDQHIVLIFDWATESDKKENGWLEAAADALFTALQTRPEKLQLSSGAFLSTSHNLHFIGHSRGAVLNSRVCNRIGWWFPELKVDHVTSLDPHPAGPMNDFGFDSATGTGALDTYQKVQFADNYYRRDPAGYEPGIRSSDFSGVPVRGVSFERELNETVLSASDSPNERDEVEDPYTLEHVKTHAWYHGTISQTATADGDDVTIPTDWYTPANMGPRATTGFYYSRAASGHTSFSEPNNRRDPESIPVLFNGDIQFAYVPFGGITSKSSIPGWEHHGGSGSAFQTSGTDQSLTLNFNDSSRTHNRFYLPQSVTKLEFDYRIPNPGANDRLKVVLTDDSSFTLSIPVSANQTLSQWNSYLIDVPASLQGKVVRLTFQLENTSSGVISSEVNIRNVTFTDTTAPTVEFVSPTAPFTIRSSSLDFEIEFSEMVKAYGTGKPDQAALVLGGTARTGVTVSSPQLVGRNRWRYTLSNITQNGPLTVSLASGTIQDLFGNYFPGQSWAYAVDLSGGSSSATTEISRTPEADAYVSQNNPTINYGTSPFLLNYSSSVPSMAGRHDSLVKFNVSAIPAGSTVETAELRLTATGAANSDYFEIGKALNSWTETGVTWNNSPGQATAFILAINNNATPSFHSDSFSGLKSAVQGWVSTPGQNYGLYLRINSGSSATFYSKDDGTASRHPTLVITYREPQDNQGDTITGLSARKSSSGSTISEREWQRDNDPYFSWSQPSSVSPIMAYSWALDAQPSNAQNLSAPAYPFPNNSLTDGMHYFRVKSVDKNGNWGPVAGFEIWVDTSPPALAITGPTSSGSYSTTVSEITLSGAVSDLRSGVQGVTWSTSNGASGTAAQYGNGSTWEAHYIPLQTGANVITVTALDRAGNSSSANYVVEVDNVPPQLAITSPVSSGSYTGCVSKITLSGTVFDLKNGVSEVTWSYWYNPPSGSCTVNAAEGTWTTPSIQLSEGENLITIRATDGVGNTSSATLQIQHILPQVQPTNQTVAAGSSTTLIVSSGDNLPLTYQWLYGGTPIVGATNSALTLNNVQPDDAGLYQITVSNMFGTVLGTGALLIVTGGNQDNFLPTLSGTTWLYYPDGNVPARSTDFGFQNFYTFQILSSTVALLTRPPQDAYLFNVQRVFSTLKATGVWTGRFIDFTVFADRTHTVETGSYRGPPAYFTIHPQGQTWGLGSNATFNALARFPLASSYQWLCGGEPISGATNSTLVVSNVQPESAGVYWVVASNAWGAIASLGATLSVTGGPPSLLPVSGSGEFSLNWRLDETPNDTYLGINEQLWPSDGPGSFGRGGFHIWRNGQTLSESSFISLGRYEQLSSSVAVVRDGFGVGNLPILTLFATSTNGGRILYATPSGAKRGDFFEFQVPLDGRDNEVVALARSAVTINMGTYPSPGWYRADGGAMPSTRTSGAGTAFFAIRDLRREDSGTYYSTFIFGGTRFSFRLKVVSPVQLDPPSLSQGSVILKFRDQLGSALRTNDLPNLEVQAAAYVLSPNWTRYTNGFILTNGMIHFNDPDAPNQPRRFYRVIER